MSDQPTTEPPAAGGPAPGPIPPPSSPLHERGPYADALAALTEKVFERMEQARAADEQARQQPTGAGATGESLEGGVQVDVDGKGLIAGVRYTGIISAMTPEQLREHTLAALREAHDSLRQSRPAASAAALAQLHDRSFAMAILDVARRERQAR